MNATTETVTAGQTWYIAVSADAWGRGETMDEAKKQMKKAGGNLRTYLVYRWENLTAKPWIDESGCSVTEGPGSKDRKCVHAVKGGKVVPAPE